MRFLFLLIYLGFLSLLISCSTEKIDPLSLKISPQDIEKAELAPAPSELVIQKRLLLPLIVSIDEELKTKNRFEILQTIHDQFRKHGLFSVITQEQINHLRSQEGYNKFKLNNVADIIQLAKKVDAHFVSQMEIVLDSEQPDLSDHYQAKIDLAVFTADTGKIVFRENILFDNQNPKNSIQRLKNLVQKFFPLRGYILKTRGNKQAAKISIGSSLGIKLDREFLIREKIKIRSTINGVEQTTFSFTPLAVARARVIKVMENESWLSIDEKDRSKIKIGQIAFSEPEKVSFFE